MTTVAISGLPAASSLASGDVIIVNQSGVTKQATLSFIPYVTFPSGTVMIFQQTSAPTGWTKSVSNNDKALRIVSGTASTGGAVAFTSVFNAAGGSTILTTAHLPASGLSIPSLSVTATSTTTFQTATGAVDGPVGSGGLETSATVTSTGSTGTGTTGNMGSGTGHTHVTPDLMYVDVISAVKD